MRIPCQNPESPVPGPGHGTTALAAMLSCVWPPLSGCEMNRQPSPLITDISWGRMRVEGLGAGKDFKLWPGGGRAWDWSETGTRHVPGIQPGDVGELLEHGCRSIVLSSGMLERLQTCPATLEMLADRGVDVHVAETARAVAIYNDLARCAEPVGGLFHSTC